MKKPTPHSFFKGESREGSYSFTGSNPKSWRHSGSSSLPQLESVPGEHGCHPQLARE